MGGPWTAKTLCCSPAHSIASTEREVKTNIASHLLATNVEKGKKNLRPLRYAIRGPPGHKVPRLRSNAPQTGFKPNLSGVAL
jgi:hypothetical protein